MPIRENIDDEIALLRGLQVLSSTYEEISVMRIERVREHVLASRRFREGLMQVFSEVRSSHRREVERLEQKEAEGRRRRGRRAAILLSANEHWSGTISQDVARYFLEQIDGERFDELIVMGDAGRDFIKKTRPKLSFSSIELPDFNTPLTSYQPLIRRLNDFDAIMIVYGKFVNMLQQVPTKDNLTGAEVLREEAEKSAADNDDDYLFEPSLPAVVRFFETQIFALLLRQLRHEAALSQLGSRITAMEQASQNITGSLQDLTFERVKQRRAVRSRKQREKLAGLTLWSRSSPRAQPLRPVRNETPSR